MKLKHVTSAKQFDAQTLKLLFSLTDKIKSGNYDKQALSGKIMATLFYQPSTRTRLSFESAILRLGGQVIATENATESSSAIKGETLEDTIRIVNCYSDVIVLRHPQSGSADIATQYSNVPIINAGDGIGEHPTQALLDLYTIYSHFKNLDITIAIAGDHAHYRPTHSLTYFLSLFPQVKIVYISPQKIKLPADLRELLVQQKIDFKETEDFNEGIEDADVIYQTRIPKEYLGDDYQKYKGKYILSTDNLTSIKKDAIIMHPLPRVDEITKEIDQDPRAMYFEQAQNGLYTRMALLLYLFDKEI